MRPVLFFAALLCACDTPAPNPDNTDDSGPENVDDIVFYGDIEATLDTYCVRCHQADGGGPFDFTDYETVKSLSPAIVAAIDSGRMPPPASDPDCRDYQGSEIMVIPEEEKQRVRDWIAAEMPAGDPADELPMPTENIELPSPDLTVRINEPYTPTYTDANNPGNEYRCFTIDHNQAETFFITGVQALIDKQQISHHIVLSKVEKNSDEANRGRQPGGFDCIDNAGVGVQSGGMLHGWAPGMGPTVFENGVGLAITPDDAFILQMHYYKSSEEAVGLQDQPGYAFTTAPSVTTPAFMLPFGPSSFRIPAGDEAYTDTTSITLPISGKLHAIFPHMHILGKSYSMYAGDECIAEGDYDFDNQIAYYFNEPANIEVGTRVSISCTWNNSTSNPDLIHNPPQDVRYGERTDEEMCYGFALVSL